VKNKLVMSLVVVVLVAWGAWTHRPPPSPPPNPSPYYPGNNVAAPSGHTTTTEQSLMESAKNVVLSLFEGVVRDFKGLSDTPTDCPSGGTAATIQVTADGGFPFTPCQFVYTYRLANGSPARYVQLRNDSAVPMRIGSVSQVFTIASTLPHGSLDLALYAGVPPRGTFTARYVVDRLAAALQLIKELFPGDALTPAKLVGCVQEINIECVLDGLKTMLAETSVTVEGIAFPVGDVIDAIGFAFNASDLVNLWNATFGSDRIGEISVTIG
jgi:hypothetical protein